MGVFAGGTGAVLLLRALWIRKPYRSDLSALPGLPGCCSGGGVPAALAVWTLAFSPNLNAGLTHYGTGSAPVYFAGTYVSQNTWWAVGFVVSMVNLAIWLGLGPLVVELPRPLVKASSRR